MSSVGSFQYQIVLCSSLHFLLKVYSCSSNAQSQGFNLLHLSLPGWFPPSLFILVSSVCKSLQCLISALTRGGKGGHLFRLTVQLCWGEGGNLQTNITGMLGSVCSAWTMLGLPRPKAACTFWVHTAQAPGCSERGLSQVGPAFYVLPRSKPLRFLGALQGHRPRWAVCFVPFPGPSHSGDWVLGQHRVPGGPCILCTSLVPATQFPECATKAPSQVYRVSPLRSRSQAVTLLADVNHPGSQEDVISNWEPAHSLAEDAVSCPRLQQPLAFWL